jgi:hypothetical protein
MSVDVSRVADVALKVTNLEHALEVYCATRPRRRRQVTGGPPSRSEWMRAWPSVSRRPFVPVA